MGCFQNLWVDDQWDDPNTPSRHPPKGYTPCRTALEAIRCLKNGISVLEISLDHDLGDHVIGNGYTVARYIERETFMGRLYPIRIHVHSANPVGRDRILASVRACDNYWISQQQKT